MDFTLSKAQLPQERAVIDEFLYKHFFRDFNLVEAFGLEDKPPPPIPDCADFVVKALDSQGQLAGVAYSTTHPTELWEPDKTLREKQLYEFFHFFEEDAQLNKLPEQTVEVWLVAVQEGFRGRGLARMMLEESERVARDSGFKHISITCTNEFTAKLAQKLSWKERYRLAYKDYPKRSGRDVYLKSTPPHDHIYYFVKEL